MDTKMKSNSAGQQGDFNALWLLIFMVSMGVASPVYAVGEGHFYTLRDVLVSHLFAPVDDTNLSQQELHQIHEHEEGKDLTSASAYKCNDDQKAAIREINKKLRDRKIERLNKEFELEDINLQILGLNSKQNKLHTARRLYQSWASGVAGEIRTVEQAIANGADISDALAILISLKGKYRVAAEEADAKADAIDVESEELQIRVMGSRDSSLRREIEAMNAEILELRKALGDLLTECDCT